VAAIALALPESGRDAPELAVRVERLLLGAVEGLARRSEEPGDLRLHVLVRADELPRAAELLRTRRPAQLPASVMLRAVEAVERRDPRGGRVVPPEPRAADSVK
jgi:hypothetical protein